jgi:geranylgeranyl diphosphate synthase, type I
MGVTVQDVETRGLSTTLPAQVDRVLAGFLDRRIAEIGRAGLDLLVPVLDLLRSHVLGGGKRLRPLFCYWGWRGAGGVDCGTILAGAAAMELFHAFALIHDDIMDASDTRRGAPTMHRRLAGLHRRSSWRGDSDAFGEAAAILVGDLCMAWADDLLFETRVDGDRLRAGRRVYAAMRTEVMAGQYLDLVEQAHGPTQVSRALTVAQYKTAKYTVERPLQLGAALAGAADPVLTAYSAYAMPLGEAFQLRDDLLGVYGNPAVTGKSAVDDLRAGKATVLVTSAVERASASQRARVARLLGNPALDEQGAAELRAVLDATGAPRRVQRMIASRTRQAIAAVRTAPITEEARTALVDLAMAATGRAG